MRLSRVKVENYCSCRLVELDLAAFNPIIGYNNSGKSNVLRAISWLLKKSSLPAHCFWDTAQPVVVEGTIRDVDLTLLPANQQAQVAPFLVNHALTFRRRQEAPSASAAQIRIEVFNPATNQWATNPTGLDNAIGQLFPEPIYVEAMEDAAEEVAKFAAKNTIGVLLKYTAERIRNQNPQAFGSIQQALQQVGALLEGPQRVQQLAALETEGTQAISEFFPGISLHLKISAPEFDDLVKAASISLADANGAPRPFNSFGHGAQRSVHMALIRLLASYSGGAAGSTVVLLIDEPELYLHPQAIEILRDALKSLAAQGFQVIFSTHSPLLIGADEVLETKIVYKDQTGTRVRQHLGSAAAVLANNPHHAGVVFSLQNASYLLFSESVLVVEGKTERMVIPEIHRAVTGHTMRRQRRCLIETSGSGSIQPTIQVLTAVGFSAKACVDLDYIFRVAAGQGLIAPNDPDIAACMAWFSANQGLGYYLDAAGLPTKTGPNGATATLSQEQAFEQLAISLPVEVGRLAVQMRQQGFWVWERGAIEAHLGIAKTDQARIAYVQATRASGNLVHSADVQSLVLFASWI